MLKEETKTGGTKRRAYTSAYVSPVAGALSRRINRLSKRMKANNPTHLWAFPATTWAPSNTASIVDLCGQIAQGDDYDDR